MPKSSCPGKVTLDVIKFTIRAELKVEPVLEVIESVEPWNSIHNLDNLTTSHYSSGDSYCQDWDTYFLSDKNLRAYSVPLPVS